MERENFVVLPYHNQNKYKDVIIMIKYKLTENEVYSQFFSFEVLDYFDSITTDENFEWIEKYFNVLMKSENEYAEKFDMHHIRPCCTFKTNTRTKRAETKPLADKFNGNLIKLSVYNHIFAHFYLWKIFNTRDSKVAFQRMCGQSHYVDNLIEKELDEIAKLKEECAKKNQTKEELKKIKKQYHENNKEKILKRKKERYQNNKEKILKKNRERYQQNKEKKLKQQKEHRENNKEDILKLEKEWRKNHKENVSKSSKKYYRNNKEKILKQQKERYQQNKEEINRKINLYNNQDCIDPIKGDVCSLCALRHRIERNKKLYGNRIARDYIIKNN